MLKANCDYLLHLLIGGDWIISRKDIAKEVTNIIQSTKFWSQGHEGLLILKPLVQVLRLVDGDR